MTETTDTEVEVQDVLSGELAGPIKAAAISVEKARVKVEDAKTALKAAKGVLELEEKGLRGLLHDASTGQRRLPLKDGEAPGTAHDGWRTYSVVDLGLGNLITSKLTDSGINTLGELSDFTAPNASGYCKRYTDITGIGEGGSEKITEAFDLFWSDHPEFCQGGAEDAGETEDAEPVEDPAEEPDQEPEEAPVA